MCDLIFDFISFCVWGCDTSKINVYDEIMIENKKKIENMEIEELFYINLHLKDGLWMEFTVC